MVSPTQASLSPGLCQQWPILEASTAWPLSVQACPRAVKASFEGTLGKLMAGVYG